MDVKEEVTNEIFEIKVKEVCYWDNRKKCDSLYIEQNNKLKKKIYKVLDVVEKCSDKKVKKEIKKILENV